MMCAEQVIWNIHVYKDSSVGEKFCATPNEDICNRFVDPSMTKVRLVPNGDSSGKYVGHVLGRVSECYLALVAESGETELLGKKSVVTGDEQEQREVL